MLAAKPREFGNNRHLLACHGHFEECPFFHKPVLHVDDQKSRLRWIDLKNWLPFPISLVHLNPS